MPRKKPTTIQIAIIINVVVLIGLIISGLWQQAANKEDVGVEAVEEKVVNIYSYRQPDLINPLLKKFTAETGIKTQVIFAKKGLLERIRIEGQAAPADIILTSDIGILHESADIAQVVLSPVLRARIPAPLRDGGNQWFGLSQRARIAFVSKARVADEALTYLELAQPRFRGRLCMRSGQHPYNIALFAAMLVHLGEADFRAWLAGIKNNLAQNPSGNDRAQVRNVYGGVCDIAIGNTYYMGKMLTNTKQPQQKRWADSVRLIFPAMPASTAREKKGKGGTHINISGMAMAKYAPHPKAALALMEYLVGNEAQQLYAQGNFEYPIVAGLAPAPLVASWGEMIPDTLAMADIAGSRKTASRIVDEINFNE